MPPDSANYELALVPPDGTPGVLGSRYEDDALRPVAAFQMMEGGRFAAIIPLMKVPNSEPKFNCDQARSIGSVLTAKELEKVELVQHRRAHQRRFAMPATDIKDHVYKVLELVGSSETGMEDAIHNAIGRASKTIREMKWFEVVQTRGHIENGSIRHFQVTLRIGFTLED
jgi:flavin-binding protein dodecin